MDLNQAGIAILCRCGAYLAADVVNVLFDDRGRVKIGQTSIRCSKCGAIYHRGERLRYRLVNTFNTSGGRG